MTTAPAPRPRSRAVMWTGLMLGTALAALAMADGIHLKIGGPSFIGWILGGLIVWLLVVLAATAVAEMLRRHHRTIGRYAGRQATRAGRHGVRLARRHGGRGLNAATQWAGGRWNARQAGPPSMWTVAPGMSGPGLSGPAAWWRRARRSADDSGTEAFTDPNPTSPDGFAPVPGDEAASPGGGAPARPLHMPDEAAGSEWGAPDPDAVYGAGPWMLAVRRRDGRPYYDAPFSPLVATAMVWNAPDLRRRLAAAAADPDLAVRVIPLKLTDPDLAASTPPAAATANQHEGDSSMTSPATEHQPVNYWPNYNGPGSQRRPARIVAAPEANGTWRPLIGSTHDFEPENDAHLLGWMAGEAGGMTAYAEAVQDVYETTVNSVGVDPVAMAALHDYADAAASAAEAMAAARQRFADHYAEVRTFAANGGVLPFNGRWMTGEGD